MGDTSRWCVSLWKTDINHCRYSKVVNDIWGIANLFHAEKNTEWIEALDTIIVRINKSSDKKIMPHIKKHLTDFLEVAKKAIDGKCTKQKLRKEKDKTLQLLSIAYSS